MVGVGSNGAGVVGVDESLCGETVTWAVGARVAVAGTVVGTLGTAVGVGKIDSVDVGVGTTVEITAMVRVGATVSCGEPQPNIARPNKHPTTTIRGRADIVSGRP